MAWSTPATFVDANVLSATQLNVLGDDLAFLYGLLKAPQPAMAVHYANRDLTSANNAWKIRYRHRYIHYRALVVANTCNAISLWVNGTEYAIDATARGAPYTYSGYVDVNAQGLTEGTIYTCYFTTSLATQNTSAVIVEYLIQAEGTSL